MKSERIMNRDRARQLMAFDDLEWKRLRPTDLDLSFDVRQRLFIFGELKTSGTYITVGQRIHMEGLVNAIRRGGKPAYAFWASHSTTDPSEDVHVAVCPVRAFYDGTTWQDVEGINVKQFMDTVMTDEDGLSAHIIESNKQERQHGSL